MRYSRDCQTLCYCGERLGNRSVVSEWSILQTIFPIAYWCLEALEDKSNHTQLALNLAMLCSARIALLFEDVAGTHGGYVRLSSVSVLFQRQRSFMFILVTSTINLFGPIAPSTLARSTFLSFRLWCAAPVIFFFVRLLSFRVQNCPLRRRDRALYVAVVGGSTPSSPLNQAIQFSNHEGFQEH